MQLSVRRRVASTGWLATSATTLLVASVPALMTGCSGNDVMATIGMPTSETETAHGDAGAAPPGPLQAGGQSNAVVVTAKQREYLDALNDAGVKPSSNLAALSIGSYVCQARAAKQNDHAVWDFVRPVVRGDVDGDGLSSAAPSAADIDTATAEYIRIATERLC
ncbi:DUF732 domain-containing protein [Mycolicibacterium tusciae]|uniref:DUF732 domain-containing protein n=1 Tax=Mycolicibacterium tusciae TaxID=75922 RepID=UPI000D1D1366|nr:DUF732 domain-containing protein [Mycolicibacterium tusciae]